jgi:hypothetical protein
MVEPEDVVARLMVEEEVARRLYRLLGCTWLGAVIRGASAVIGGAGAVIGGAGAIIGGGAATVEAVAYDTISKKSSFGLPRLSKLFQEGGFALTCKAEVVTDEAARIKAAPTTGLELRCVLASMTDRFFVCCRV